MSSYMKFKFLTNSVQNKLGHYWLKAYKSSVPYVSILTVVERAMVSFRI